MKEVEDKHNEYENLDNQVYEYEGKASAAKEQMDRAVQSKDTTLEELGKYTSLRGRLSPLGLDLRDLDRVESCLANVAEQGGDPVAVAAFYSRGVGLSENVKVMEARVGYLSTQELVAGNKLRETNKVLESKTELAARVREAEAIGLKPSQLGVLVETTREVGVRHGLGVKESISRLEADLKMNWESKLGFENDKTKLAAELDQMGEKVKLAEEREKIIFEKIRAHEEALEELDQLRKHVSAGELIEFKRVIVDSGRDVPTFRGEVERLGSVTAAVDSLKQRKEAEVAKLETRATTLIAQVDQLNSTKIGLEAKIITLHSKAIESIISASNTIVEVADGLKEDFEHPELGFRAIMQTIKVLTTAEVNQSLTAQREKLEQSIGKLAKFIERSEAEVTRLRESTWSTGMIVGRNIHLTHLYRIVAGLPVKRVEAVATMNLTVGAFSDYLMNEKLAYKCPSASSFAEELRGLLVE